MECKIRFTLLLFAGNDWVSARFIPEMDVCFLLPFLIFWTNMITNSPAMP